MRSTRLTPPAVRPMSDATRQRIRHHVLDSATAAVTGPSRPRRWLPAIAAVAAVTVVAGIAVGTGRLTGDPDTPPAAASAHPDPRAIVVDRGAPSASQIRVAKQACLGERPGPATVLLARRVIWRPAPITPETVTAIVLRTAGGEYLACHTMGHKAAASSAPAPTASEPLKLLADSGLAEFYRVHPSVARIEARVSWPERGRPSDWSVAVIANGVAYVLGDPGEHGLEVRAFDAAGRQLEIPNRIPPQQPTPTPNR